VLGLEATEENERRGKKEGKKGLERRDRVKAGRSLGEEWSEGRPFGGRELKEDLEGLVG